MNHTNLLRIKFRASNIMRFRKNILSELEAAFSIKDASTAQALRCIFVHSLQFKFSKTFHLAVNTGA